MNRLTMDQVGMVTIVAGNTTLKLWSKCLMILYCLVAATSLAESVGSKQTISGNSLNPNGTDTTRVPDSRGLSAFKEIPSRTPTGLMYAVPTEPPNHLIIGDSWQLSGSLEAGVIANDGDENAAGFNEYSDWRDGPLLNFFSLSSWQANSGYHINAFGGGVGRDDQYYRLEGGQYGSFKLNAFFDKTPHVFHSDITTFFSGVGSQHLTLPQTLTPGNNTTDQIRQALDSAYNTSIDLSRDRSGAGFELTAFDGLKLFGHFTHEARTGTRPFGGSFLSPFDIGDMGGGVVETIEPIDYKTNDIAAGASYSNQRYQFNLNYTGSFFRNNKEILTWENPFTNLPGDSLVIERGRFALYPDNNFHQIKADLAIALPLRGRITSTVSWSRMHQDDDLVPATINSGQTDSGVDLDQWNITDSLSRRTANAEIDNWLFQIGGQFSPWNPLTVRARFRYTGEDNKTRYTAFNSLTNQFGYIVVDGAEGGAVFEPGQINIPIHYRSIPFEESKTNWLLQGDYRIARKTVLGIKYDYKKIKYDYRERDSSHENRVKTTITIRSIDWATLRLSYQYANRDGSTYNFFPYSEFYTSSLPEFNSILPNGSTPHTLADLRKFDLNDRKQHRTDVRTNFLISDNMDGFLSLKWSKNEYDARFGLKDEKTSSINLEWDFRPTTQLNTYAHYNYQRHQSRIGNINDVGFSSDPNAGGASFPLNAAWKQDIDDKTHVIGIGLNYSIGPYVLNSSYSYLWSRNEADYDFASNLALASPEFDRPVAGDPFPDIRFKRQILETNLRWRLNKKMALRFYHRYESGQTRDWHFDGLEPLIGNQLFLVTTAEDYAVHLFGVFIQYRFD